MAFLPVRWISRQSPEGDDDNVDDDNVDDDDGDDDDGDNLTCKC